MANSGNGGAAVNNGANFDWLKKDVEEGKAALASIREQNKTTHTLISESNKGINENIAAAAKENAKEHGFTRDLITRVSTLPGKAYLIPLIPAIVTFFCVAICYNPVASQVIDANGNVLSQTFDSFGKWILAICLSLLAYVLLVFLPNWNSMATKSADETTTDKPAKNEENGDQKKATQSEQETTQPAQQSESPKGDSK